MERIAIFLGRARTVARRGFFVALVLAGALFFQQSGVDSASAELSARALEFLGAGAGKAGESASLIDPRRAAGLDLDDSERQRLIANTVPDFVHRTPPLAAHHVAALLELIERNGLGEASSLRDHDDGNGQLDAWELGHQLWLDGNLVALSLEATPHESYGYRLGSLPASIATIETLQVLELRHNALRRLPPEIGALQELRVLDLFANDLAEVPDSLTQLSELRHLSLSSNPLIELPAELARLSALEEIHLRDTTLEKLPEQLMQIPTLLVLDLSRSGKRTGEPETRELAELLASVPESQWHNEILAGITLAAGRLGCDLLSGIESIDRLALGSAMQVHGLHAERCTRKR